MAWHGGRYGRRLVIVVVFVVVFVVIAVVKSNIRHRTRSSIFHHACASKEIMVDVLTSITRTGLG